MGFPQGLPVRRGGEAGAAPQAPSLAEPNYSNTLAEPVQYHEEPSHQGIRAAVLVRPGTGAGDHQVPPVLEQQGVHPQVRGLGIELPQALSGG